MPLEGWPPAGCREDVSSSPSFEIPKPLAEFFLHQIDQYAGASNTAL